MKEKQIIEKNRMARQSRMFWLLDYSGIFIFYKATASGVLYFLMKCFI